MPLQRLGITDSCKTTDESPVRPVVNWESKFHEKEKEWREKEKAYVTDLLKQTKELQEALSQVEGMFYFIHQYLVCVENYYFNFVVIFRNTNHPLLCHFFFLLLFTVGSIKNNIIFVYIIVSYPALHISNFFT